MLSGVIYFQTDEFSYIYDNAVLPYPSRKEVIGTRAPCARASFNFSVVLLAEPPSQISLHPLKLVTTFDH